ncbi:MAG: hypothetical protein VX875_01350 [Pseudomonadota bacterium]|nr:hypothetical protein [Pseudomonadota bacterium]
MTEIQQTNFAVANFILGELHKEKPFNLVLNAGETGALYNIASESHHLHSNFVQKLEASLRQRVNNGTGVILTVDDSNADLYYHILSPYVAVKAKSEKCVWRENEFFGTFHTDCENLFELSNSDSLVQNKIYYCPFCGKQIDEFGESEDE